MQQMWRPCTDDGLRLGRTSLIERRDGRFVVRARGEIDRLLKCAYDGEPPVDRLMSGLASGAQRQRSMFGTDRRGSFADARSGECRGRRRAGG